MLPSQINPTKSRDAAHAPYNFVPLPDQPVLLPADSLPDQDRYHPDRRTGRIVCKLTTVTPTYVRAPLEPDEFVRRLQEEAWAEKHPDDARKRRPENWVKNKPDFFYAAATTEPRIPASVLRGMTRALVQIITAARFEAVTNRRLVYRAVADTTSHGLRYRNQIMDYYGERNGQKYYTPRVKAGYLSKVNGEWRLQPARTIHGATFARISHDQLKALPGSLTPVRGCKNARVLYIEPGRRKFQAVRGGFIRIHFAKVQRAAEQPGNGLCQAVLACSGKMKSKRSEAVVYEPDWSLPWLAVDDAVIDQYRDQLTPKQRELLGPGGVLSAGEETPDGATKGTLDYWQPVFYVQDGNRLFMGHTMMMRLSYPHTVQEYLPAALRAQAGPEVDMAQAIFGFTRDSGQGKARSYAGRVFFEDAVLVPGQRDIWIEQAEGQTEWLYPHILAGPKPTAFQHYLVQRTPDPVQNPKRDEPRKCLSDYGSPTPNTTTTGCWTTEATTLRGDKLYWHKPGRVTRAMLEADPKEVKDHPTQYTTIRPLRENVVFEFTVHFENLPDWELGALLWALLLPGEAEQQYRHKLGMGKPLGMGTVRIEPALYLQDRAARYRSLFVQDAEGDFVRKEGNLVWEEGEGRIQAAASDFVRAFEAEMARRLGLSAGMRLARLPRLRALLRMLAYPGPANINTSYMPVGHHRSRPVLPAPLNTDEALPAVLNPDFVAATVPWPPEEPDDAAPPLSPINSEAVLERLQQGSATPAPPTVAEAPTTASSFEAVKQGDYLSGSVVQITFDGRIEVDLGLPRVKAYLPANRVAPPPSQDELKTRFASGTVVHAWVERIDRRKRMVVLTLRR